MPPVAPGPTVELVSGNFHSCARLNDGTVRCWGMNREGQLGDGATTNRTSPVRVRGLSEVVQIDAEGSRTCAVTEAGELYCWGQQLLPLREGGEMTVHRTPRAVPGWGELQQIDLGSGMECGVTRAGAARCRDFNNRGGAGDGTTTPRYRLVAVSGLDSAVIDVAAGNGFGCALLSSGAVRCWGWNADYGQVGDGSGRDQLTPVEVPGVREVVDLDAGFTHVCAASRSGALWCWGTEDHGALGDGTTEPRTTPTRVSSISPVAAVSLAQDKSCAVVDGGRGRCWGKDVREAQVFPDCPQPQQMRLGGPTRGGGYRYGPIQRYCPVPSPLPPLPPIRQLAPGMSHLCALTQNGAVLCWGSNFYGALGDGHGGEGGQDSSTPVRVDLQ